MKPWQEDPFFQYPISLGRCSAGEVELPVLYYDCSSVMAMFWVDKVKAQQLVNEQGLNAISYAGGKALFCLAFYEYRQTAIGAYNEVASAIAVAPKGVKQPAMPLLSLLKSVDRQRQGFFVLDLPVTTQEACAAGRELWGYPKFVTAIDFSLTGNTFSGAVKDPSSQGSIVGMSGTVGLGIRGPQLDLISYSRNDDQMLRTTVITRGGGKICFAGSARLAVSQGSLHPMAQRLNSLDLAGAKPFAVMHTHNLQLRLNQGASIDSV